MYEIREENGFDASIAYNVHCIYDANWRLLPSISEGLVIATVIIVLIIVYKHV